MRDGWGCWPASRESVVTVRECGWLLLVAIDP